MSKLEDYRKKIDSIDEELIKLLSLRFKITRKVGEYKRENNLPAEDIKREERIREKREDMAKLLEIDTSLLNDIFSLIIKRVKEEHRND